MNFLSITPEEGQILKSGEFSEAIKIGGRFYGEFFLAIGVFVLIMFLLNSYYDNR